MRRRSGADNAPRVSVGRTAEAHVAHPETGSRRQRTLKSRMSMMPVQNTGMD